MFILRPSIIGGAYAEPHLGWVDSLGAAGAIFLLGCLGLLQDFVANNRQIADNIPVDYVSNMIIASCYYEASKPKIKPFKIYHSCSSGRNPGTWAMIKKGFVSYLSYQYFEQTIGERRLDLYNSVNEFKVKFFFKKMIPAKLMGMYASLIGNSKMKSDATKY